MLSSYTKVQSRILEYLMFTEPSQLVAMPDTSEDIQNLGHTLNEMFRKGLLKTMWIDRDTNEVQAN